MIFQSLLNYINIVITRNKKKTDRKKKSFGLFPLTLSADLR